MQRIQSSLTRVSTTLRRLYPRRGLCRLPRFKSPIAREPTSNNSQGAGSGAATALAPGFKYIHAPEPDTRCVLPAKPKDCGTAANVKGPNSTASSVPPVENALNTSGPVTAGNW